MAVKDPGQLQVICDGCGDEVMMDTTEYTGSPPSWGVDESTLTAEGWKVDGDQTYCPECEPEES